MVLFIIWIRRLFFAIALVRCSGGFVAAQVQTKSSAWLPPSVIEAMRRAQVPIDALHVVVMKPQSNNATPWTHNANEKVNPASLMKLVTTAAALDILGPAFVWNSPVFIEGAINEGVLQGNVYIKGQGDPRLGVEKLWLLMRRLRGLGIARIQGDIFLDRTAFDLPPHNPASFDGEPLRPYNASADALLINFKSMLIYFVPDLQAKVARIHTEPPQEGVSVASTVPLIQTDCNDYRSALKAQFQNPQRIVFLGGYPATCGEKVWPIAAQQPDNFAARTVSALWLSVGGQLNGKVRDGVVPANLKPAFQNESPTLSEVVRDINKFSNNVMAEQLFLTLALQQSGTGNSKNARDAIATWWSERLANVPAPQIENGSGLSRESRIHAMGLAQLLLWAWRSPIYPELASSLPMTGMDGTLKRMKTQASAHLKTGSLRDVVGVAGYVDGPLGQRWILVAIIYHNNANAARPALDALINWTAQQP
ncbi:MAG: D-alanyl-D-alanine carboxypeptidase/D-alanyl-D-alanine-endopeptidase [Limnohabitans sp.]|nr:D-alanyl-D-alanine carboxypeptidase/D-alanyl-D-alanine-endopeptidase [Limnohabitans sp.]